MKAGGVAEDAAAELAADASAAVRLGVALEDARDASFIIPAARSMESSATAGSFTFTLLRAATAPGNSNRASWPNAALSSAFATSRSTLSRSLVEEKPSRPRWITRRPTPRDALPETVLSWLSWNRTPALSASP